MTTPNPGAALAEAVAGLCARYRSELSYDPADLLEDIEDAVDTYRASQVGERVRLAVYRWDDGEVTARENVNIVHRTPICYVEFPVPSRTTPPSVEGSVVQ